MPVRSLSSSVLKWPDAHTVDQAVRQWAGKVGHNRNDVLGIGYFGSYARGDWGVGSDLDVVVVVVDSERPLKSREREWDATELPVPADVLVYTHQQWQSLKPQGRFYQTMMREVIWVYVRERVETLLQVCL